MTHVYLDQNQWSYLSLALHGEPRTPEDAAAAETVKRSVADGTASFPLSTAHVFETWKQHCADKRQLLAQTMTEISRNDAIASPQQLLPPELDQALYRRFGRPDPPAEVEPFGRGLKHLSGGLAPDPDPDLVPYLRDLHPDLDDAEITDSIDALLLAGPDENLPTAEVGQPDLRFAEGFAADQAALQQRLKQEGASKDEIRRAVAVNMLMDIKEPLEAALGRAAVTLDEFTALGRQGLTDFMFDLPSRVALLELMWRQHADLQTTWKPNDLNDLVYLSAAIGYCDIVVTERRWSAMLAQIDVRSRTGTTVLGKLAELPVALVGHGPRP
jgi:flagellar motor switch/type III secretory pathway protein FliN